MAIKSLSLSGISDMLAKICLLAIVFCVPLYFAVFLPNNNIFELNKIVLFRVLVWALILLTVIRALTGKGARAGNFNDFFRSLFSRKYFLIPLLFILALAFAAIFSIDRELSFSGLYDRQQGLLSQIYYFLFFILVLLNVKNKNQIKRLLAAMALSSFFACIYGIIQKLGLDPMPWKESSQIRISSTLGQPNFFASWLLLVMPLSAYLFFVYRRWAVKIFFAFLFFLQFTCLFLTYSRGGWLGFGAGLVVFSFLAVCYRYAGFFIPHPESPGRNKPYASTPACSRAQNKFTGAGFTGHKVRLFGILLSLLILLSVAAVCAFRESPLLRERVRGLVDIKSSGAASRIDNLLAGADAILKRPILGYGPETQGEIFARYYRRDWALYNNANVYPNRAHNIVIDTLMTGGIVGLTAYILLLVMFAKLSLENIGKKRSFGSLSLYILTAVSAYLVSLLFGFATVVTNIYFWFFLALIIVLHRLGDRDGARIVDTVDSGLELSASPAMRAAYKIFIVFAACACFIFLAGRAIKPLMADYYFWEARKALVAGNYPLSFTLWGYAGEVCGEEKYYDRQFGEMLAERMESISSAPLRNIAKGILKNIFDYLGDNDYHDIFARARVATTLAAYGRDKDFTAAEELWLRAISLAPEMPQNYNGLGRMYYFKGDYDKAIENYRLALSALPDINDPAMTTSRLTNIYLREYYNYMGLANAYGAKNDPGEAEKNTELAKNKYDGIARFKAGEAERVRGNLSQAVLEFQEGWRLNPKDFTWPYMLSQINRRLGDSRSAIYYAGEALRLSPANPNVQKLNNELKKKKQA